jgi:uncharacterized protein (DUF885 family)
MNTYSSIGALALTLLASLCGTSAAGAADATASNSKAQLEAIYKAEWERWLKEDPTLGTSIGDSRYDDLWPDMSLAAIVRSDAADRVTLDKLNHIDVSGLTAADRMTYDIVKLQFEELTAAMRFKPYVYAISHQGALQGTASPQSSSELAEIAPFETVRNYENWIARLNSFGPYVDQVTALLCLIRRPARSTSRSSTCRPASPMRIASA